MNSKRGAGGMPYRSLRSGIGHSLRLRREATGLVVSRQAASGLTLPRTAPVPPLIHDPMPPEVSIRQRKQDASKLETLLSPTATMAANLSVNRFKKRETRANHCGCPQSLAMQSQITKLVFDVLCQRGDKWEGLWEGRQQTRSPLQDSSMAALSSSCMALSSSILTALAQESIHTPKATRRRRLPASCYASSQKPAAAA
eukprot:1169654-Rhodomonas_salina.2